MLRRPTCVALGTLYGGWQYLAVRLVVQRVSSASVTVGDGMVASIGAGLLVLVGVGHGDTTATADAAGAKVAGLRIFSDDAGRMNRSVVDVGGEVLAVSQFTLLGDAGRGRRPSFTPAAPPDVAEPLVGQFVESLRAHGVTVGTGVFGAHMGVSLVNDGPVTLVLEF